MRKAVKSSLPDVGQPSEFAVVSDGILYTAHVPVRADGTFETGDFRAQLVQTLANLTIAVEAAGGTLDDVTQIWVNLKDRDDIAVMNEVWREVFRPPYPQRATVIVNGFVRETTKIMIVAHAHVGTKT
jgi:2-iminobutanoate/2-iminopropanoate deaminase